MPAPNPTADYRKYPKGPNFGLIVVLSAVTIVILLALGIFVLRSKGKTLDPHKPNPTPNSSLQVVPGPARLA